MSLKDILLPILLLSPLAARADSIFNFESTTAGTALPLTLTNAGLTATFTGSASVCGSGGAFSLLSGNIIIQSLCSSNAVSPLGGSFSQNLSSLKFDFATAGSVATVTVNLFENGVAAGTSMFTSTVDAKGNGEGLISVSGLFNSYTLTGTTFLAEDNFDAVVVSATATPEPSSFWFLGTGLLSVAGSIRRRFSSKA